jgi:hypothetical protein
VIRDSISVALKPREDTLSVVHRRPNELVTIEGHAEKEVNTQLCASLLIEDQHPGKAEKYPEVDHTPHELRYRNHTRKDICRDRLQGIVVLTRVPGGRSVVTSLVTCLKEHLASYLRRSVSRRQDERSESEPLSSGTLTSQTFLLARDSIYHTSQHFRGGLNHGEVRR